MTGAKVHNSNNLKMLESINKKIDSKLQGLLSEFTNGIMDGEGEIRKIFEMKTRYKKVADMHPYKITYTDKSGWFTTVDDPTQPYGKRKIRKSREEDLWETLADWYLDLAKTKKTLEEVFPEWIERKTTPKNAANIHRLKIEWSSYYATEPMSKDIISKPMNELTTLELRLWAEKLLKKHFPVDKKKFSRIFTIMNQCFEYAADEDIGIIQENQWNKARKKINNELIIARPTPPDETQVFTDDERKQIKEYIYKDLYKKKSRPTSAGLQILFMFASGLRLGECCGIKWSDIKNGSLNVQRQANNKTVKEFTKGKKGGRTIILTEEALAILEDVKKYNEQHNLTAEWVFQSGDSDKDYRLSYNAVNNKLDDICEYIQTPNKTSHKLRKTFASILLDDPNVNNRSVQRYLGHQDIATTLDNYNFDRKTKEQQAKAISKAIAL